MHQRALDVASSPRLVLATALGAAAVTLPSTLTTESPSAAATDGVPEPPTPGTPAAGRPRG